MLNNTKELIRAQKRFQSKAVIKPSFNKTGKERDEILEALREQAYCWRLTAFALIILTLILSSGLVYQTSQNKIVPYVVFPSKEGLKIVETSAQPDNLTFIENESQVPGK